VSLPANRLLSKAQRELRPPGQEEEDGDYGWINSNSYCLDDDAGKMPARPYEKSFGLKFCVFLHPRVDVYSAVRSGAGYRGESCQ